MINHQIEDAERQQSKQPEKADPEPGIYGLITGCHLPTKVPKTLNFFAMSESKKSEKSSVDFKFSELNSTARGKTCKR